MVAGEIFRTVEELDAYFAQEKLTCLLCGKAFAGLHTHIHSAHGITGDEYRAMFGIPQSRGLAGQQFREKSSQRMIAMRQEGKLAPSPSKEHIDRMRDIMRGKKRKVLPCHIDAVRKGKAAKPLPSASVCEEFLRRIRSGRSIRDVACDTDMPGELAFRRYLRNNSAFEREVKRALDNLPFSVQIAEKCIGESLCILVIILRDFQDLSWPDVDHTLLLPKGKARNVYERMQKRGQLTHYRVRAAK